MLIPYVVGANLKILLQGGGWCNNIRTCVYRKKTRRGSSAYMEREIPFTGILSNDAQENPGFHSTELPTRTTHYVWLSYLAHIVPYDCRFFQLE